MARNDRDTDKSTFRPEDEIDELFAGASPNPKRVGCPGRESLRAAARKALSIEHQTYDHLAECSECYREFRGYQQRLARRRWFWAPLAAAAVLVLAVVGAMYGGRNLGIGPWSSRPEAMVLDYRNEGVNRSEAGEAVRRPKTLPRNRVEATILTPIGSEPGNYEVRLVDGGQHVSVGYPATGRMENYVVRVKVTLDLRRLHRGPYSLEIRHVGDDWDSYPVIVR